MVEDTPDGKNTTHYLILSIFQRKQNCSGNYLPELDQHTTSLKLLENSFGVILPHDKPVKGMSKRTEGASDFNVRSVNIKGETTQHWLFIRSLEILLCDNSASFTHYQQEEHKPYCHTAQCNIHVQESDVEMEQDSNVSMPELNEDNRYHDLVLSSFAALNSLVRDIDLSITNVFTIPLIPGPASSYRAIYTALMKAQGITTWTCSTSSCTIVSLDLNLFENGIPIS